MKKDYCQIAIKQTELLCKIPSPSGFTKMATDFVVQECKKMDFIPTQSRKNSVIVDLGGEGEPVVLAAHVDTLGAMVRAIKSDGRLRLTKIGGFPENNIESENCIIHTRFGKEYCGTIQMVNPAVHVNRELGSTKRSDSNVEVVIDEKVFTKEDVEKLGISSGDFISFDARTSG